MIVFSDKQVSFILLCKNMFVLALRIAERRKNEMNHLVLGLFVFAKCENIFGEKRKWLKSYIRRGADGEWISLFLM